MSEKELPRLRDYLGHIIKATFLGSLLVQDAIIRNFEVIGEVSRNIDRRYPEYRACHPEALWLPAYEMRNVLSHAYFRVD